MIEGSAWNMVWRALGAPWRAICALRDPEARRGAALLFMAAGGVSMTAFAGAALYMVRTRPTLAFYLGAGALTIIAIVLTGFAGLLVKRSVQADLFGARLSIADEMRETAVKTAAATAAAIVTPTPAAEPAADERGGE